jgi:hypothetical protein
LIYEQLDDDYKNYSHSGDSATPLQPSYSAGLDHNFK